MNSLTNTSTANITIIACCILFIILLIAGIALVSVITIGLSFIVGGIGYAIEDYQSYKECYKEQQSKSND